MHLGYRLQIGSPFVSDPKVTINYRINKPNANYHKCISNKLPVYYPVTRISKVSRETIYERTISRDGNLRLWMWDTMYSNISSIEVRSQGSDWQ